MATHGARLLPYPVSPDGSPLALTYDPAFRGGFRDPAQAGKFAEHWCLVSIREAVRPYDRLRTWSGKELLPDPGIAYDQIDVPKPAVRRFAQGVNLRARPEVESLIRLTTFERSLAVVEALVRDAHAKLKVAEVFGSVGD